jgi:hypothetical protein
METSVNNNNIKELGKQLGLLKKKINKIQKIINTIDNEFKNKSKKIIYSNFIINNNKKIKIKIDEFYNKSNNNIYNSKESNSIKQPNQEYVNNNKLYDHVSVEELMIQLDSALSCKQIMDILKNNPEKNKEYAYHNYSFIFYKNIINIFILIIHRLLNKNNEAEINNKFKTFEELIEVLLKYKIFLTDKLFNDEFSNLKKVLTCKLIEFSTINGSIVAWLMFGFLNPEMINNNYYLYLNYNSEDYKNNNLEKLLENPNIKNLYEQYSSYINKNMHIINCKNNCVKDCEKDCNLGCE